MVNGSAEGIRYIIEAFTSKSGRIVGVVPSYFMFQVYSQMYGRTFIPVPYQNDLTMDVQNILDALTEETELLILLNPNNPMGNVYSKKEFQLILQHCQKHHITMLVDEAYHHFYPNTFINYALQHDHIFITRTFSKLFSMAGCRLGYVVGWKDGIEIIQKSCTPHNTNAFALLFVEKILEKPELINQLISNFQEGRKYLINFLIENEYQYKGDAGNFIFIKPKTDAKTIVKQMKDKKSILIKYYENVGNFGTCLRVSIGEKKYMKKFTKALLELD